MTVAQGAAAAEPLRLLTTTQMRRAERIAMAEGVLGLSLMEAAGRAVAESVQRRFPPCSVLVVCGPGANGGDGFVVARRLAEAGFAVRVATIGDTAKRPPDAETMAQKWSGPAPAWSPSDLEDAALIVDGVFGAGLARPLSGAATAFAEAANRTTARVVSIDAPSGLNADSGQVDGVCVQADLTVTFARKRPGHLLPPGRDLSGEVEAADIGVSDAAIAKAVADASDPIAPDLFENGPGLWRRAVAAPMRSAHKYARGHLGCLCGPAHRTGAARLAARAGLRIGAGAATLLCPPEAVPIVAAHETSVMIEPIADAEAMMAWAQERRAAALVLGPAAGVGAATRELVEAVLQLGVPCVLDADALTSFEDVSADLFGAIRKAAAPVALTPHAGEFARLFPS
ncbi:MAG: NAD(P)H-hydrate epimerase, partial [Pseudomonadota bacterium]